MKPKTLTPSEEELVADLIILFFAMSPQVDRMSSSISYRSQSRELLKEKEGNS